METQNHFLPEEILFYSRQLKLPEVGMEGQQKLKKAKVLLIGLGGLGSPIAYYLAAAGVGTIGLIDADEVAPSNLHRQILYSYQDLRKAKAQKAKERIQQLNPFIQILSYQERFTPENALTLLEEGNYQLVIDASDNFATRYLINDACVLKKIPYIFGSVGRFKGQISLFAAPQGPCYRCLYPDPPQLKQLKHQEEDKLGNKLGNMTSLGNCAEEGVLGIVPGIIGILQANEAIKYLLDDNSPHLLKGKVLMVDAQTLHFQKIQLLPNPDCPLCSDHPTLTSLEEAKAYEQALLTLKESCSTNSLSVHELTPQEICSKKEQGIPFFLLDVRSPEEFHLCHLSFNLGGLGGMLIPYSELPSRISELLPYKDQDIILYCHQGFRSQRACHYLHSQGFSRVYHLQGGINRWSREIDSSIPPY